MALRYKEVKALIFDEIIQMEPHTKIPSRVQLCEKYMVTRTTVDRSISELIGEGHLYSVNGSGTFVADRATAAAPSKRHVLNLAVLLPDITSDAYPEILRGIEDVAQSHDVNVVICNTDHDPGKQFSYVRRLINSKISGVIIIPTLQKNEHPEIYDMLQQAGIPYVFCNRREGFLDSPLVASNNFYGSYLATTHLIQRGYRRIAYIEWMHYQVSEDRCQGYLAALWHNNIPVEPKMILTAGSEFSPTYKWEGERLMAELLDSGVNPDAVFCFNDRIACGCARTIEKRGLAVSDDIGLMGYDNSSICESLPVKLSSVYLCNYEVGSNAADLVLRMIDNPESPKKNLVSFCPQLVIRESCLGKRKPQG